MPKVRIRDIDINYEVSGKGEPLLFIHGLGSSHRDWELQVPVFSEHYEVITFDIRGHGQSDKPPGPYSMAMFAADTLELIKSLGRGPVHVVGVSLGGMIALQLAVDAPEMVRSLVVANSYFEGKIRTLKDRTEIWRRTLLIKLMGMRKLGQFLGSRLFPEPGQEQLRRIFTERWAENNKRSYVSSLQAVIGWSVVDKLHRINCPTLIIASDQDFMPVSVKEKYVSKIENAELTVITNSRHATTVDQPERFNRVLMDFLSKRF